MMIWLNGKFIKEEKGMLSVFDRGFLYGEGVFETMRSYDGIPFAFKEHMRRFEKGCKTLYIPLSYSKNKILSAIRKLLILNGLNLKDAYIRITATRGISQFFREEECKNPTLLIFTREINVRELEDKRFSGINIESVNFCRDFLSQIKHTSYLPSSFAITRAIKSKKDIHEVLFLDSERHVLEGATSNVFFYRGYEIVTPLSGKIISGIMRKFVIDALKKSGYDVRERSIHYDELKQWQGAFITNSIIEMLPVSKIDRISYNTNDFKKIYDIVKSYIISQKKQ
ncbi:MAG: aminotransferase class IV [Proteobacteria bacterium]|nr:aminotransferase class IV [Pseudomonadota bacterium]